MNKKAPGQLLIISLVFLTVILILSAALFGRTANYLRFGGNSLRDEQALALAEAGIEKALWQLNETTGNYAGETGTVLGANGVFSVSIATKGPSLKTIISTGYIPDSISPRAKKTIKVDAEIGTQEIAFHYATQIGTGGVDMENGAQIAGTVWSNKTGVSITGVGSAKIVGDAYAAGTISDPPCTPPGCIKFENQPSSPPLPPFDYSYWEDKADNGGIINCAVTPSECSITTSKNIGPKKYLGNLTISGTTTVTMKGPVWVTGNLEVSGGNTVLTLDESFFGEYGTVLVVDGTAGGGSGGGTVEVTANAAIGQTSQGGYILIATSSTKSLESDPAVSIESGGATGVFYALGGMARMTSGNTNVKAVVANALSMGNNTTMTYDTGLASAQFTSGPGGGWQVKRGTYKITN